MKGRTRQRTKKSLGCWKGKSPNVHVYLRSVVTEAGIKAGTSNYIPQYLWGVITCLCPWYLLPTQHSWFHSGLTVTWSTSRPPHDFLIHQGRMTHVCVSKLYMMMTWKHFLSYWPFCEWNPSVSGGFPSQRASDTELRGFLWCTPGPDVEQTLELPVIWVALVLIVTSPECSMRWWRSYHCPSAS